MPYQGQSPGGFIGGMLYGEAARQQYQTNEAELAQKAFDLRKDKYDYTKTLDIDRALEAAAPGIAGLQSPAEQLARTANILIEQGEPTKAGELLSRSALAMSHEATAAQNQLETSIMSANAAAVLLEQVTDGPSLEAVFERTQVQGIDTKGVIPGLYQHYKTKGWDQDLEKALRMGRLSVIDKKTQMGIELDRLRGETEKARAVTESARVRLLDAQAEHERVVATNVRKTGGVATKTSAANLTYASNLVKSRFYVQDEEGEDDPARVGVLATTVATRADAILRNRPGTSAQRAVDMAFAQLNQENYFVGLPRNPGPVGTPRNPNPLPIEDGQLAADQLEVGAIYGGMGKYQGKAVKWTGTGFEVVGGR